MSNLVTRVQNILLTPKTEWPVIAAEPETTSGLYTKYILILVGARPDRDVPEEQRDRFTSTFIGTFRIGHGRYVLTWLVLIYAIGLGRHLLWSLVINALAPTFGGAEGPGAGVEDGSLRRDGRLGRRRRAAHSRASAD